MSEGRESSSAAEKDRLEYMKSSWEGSEIYRFSCFAIQNFIFRPTMVADKFGEFEPPSENFLATPLVNIFPTGKSSYESILALA